MKSFRLILILSVFSSIAMCQHVDGNIAMEFSIGSEIGIWIYDRGQSEDANESNLGWDRTLPSFFLPLEANIMYRFNRWTLGTGIGYTILFRDEMKSYAHSRSFYDIYRIANNTVDFIKIPVFAEYELVKKEDYLLSPYLKAGIFHVRSQHPDRKNFGNSFFWQAGFNNQFHLCNVWLQIKLAYDQSHITTTNGAANGSKHTIYTFGIILGLRFWL